jgi:hypothetical protein
MGMGGMAVTNGGFGYTMPGYGYDGYGNGYGYGNGFGYGVPVYGPGLGYGLPVSGAGPAFGFPPNEMAMGFNDGNMNPQMVRQPGARNSRGSQPKTVKKQSTKKKSK